MALLSLRGWADAASDRVHEMMEYSKKYRPISDYSYDGYNPYVTYPGGPYYYTPYLHYAVPLEQEFSFDQFMAQIQKTGATTVERAIALLPENMRSHNYVLMYRSRSLQEATPEAPRAIVYTPTASFIVSFNGGDPKLRGSQTIETIQYDRDKSHFEFHEITFTGHGAPHVSAANPTKCIACHQSPTRTDVDLRPNWEPYATWLGAFGSDDGDLGSTPLARSAEDKALPEDAEVLAQQAGEFEIFKHYINDVAPVHPRYSQLGQFYLGAPVELTDHLGVWNFKRIVRLITSDSEVYPLYREALAWRAKCSIDPADWQNVPALGLYKNYSYPQYYSYSPVYYDNVSSFLTWVFEPIGFDTSDWSLDFFSGGRFAFYERFGVPQNAQTTLTYAWSMTVPDYQELNALSCEDLRAKAIAKLTAAMNVGQLQHLRETHLAPAPQGQTILNRCIECHAKPDEGSKIPHIPFDQPDQLRAMLNTPATTDPSRKLIDEIKYRTSDAATEREQMPPPRRLSQAERLTLIGYIQKIAPF